MVSAPRNRRVRDAWKHAFLGPDWFPAHNPSALRRSLKRDILVLMREQTPEGGAELQAQVSAASDLIQDLDLEVGAGFGRYIAPRPFEPLQRPITAVPDDSDSE